jgi:signal transduction histidine kinase
LLIGRVSTSEYLYLNRYAQSVFDGAREALSLKRLLADHSSGFGLHHKVNSANTNAFSRQIIRSAGKSLGLTLHTIANDIVIVTLKNLKQDSFPVEERLREQGDTETIMRVFSQLRHEIGNPLNSIKLTLQVLKQNIANFEAIKVQAYIQRTIDEVGRLEKLLVSMREFSRRTPLTIREIDLRSVLGNFAQLVDTECRQAHFELAYNVDDDCRFVRADSTALTQIFHNLLRNSMQAKRQEHGSLHIRVNSGHQNGTIRVEFEDDGKGIPRGELAMVFKPMFTTKSEGTGLGLAVVERLVWQMGGSIAVASEEGRYTRFELTLLAGAGA